MISHGKLIYRSTVVGKHYTRPWITRMASRMVQGRIEAVSITTLTISGFCHLIRNKLFQGSNLTEAFNWTNMKVILSFN